MTYCFRKTLLALLFILSLVSVASADSLTLTTYYPAPFGSYSRFRLVPQTPLTGACTNGMMYVSSVDGILRYCKLDGTWGFMQGVWKQEGDLVTLSDLVNRPQSKVGIGTLAPDSQLHIQSFDTDATFRLNKDAGSNFTMVSQASSTTLGTSTNTSLAINTNNTTRIYVTNDGLCGIGTTTPDHTLEVSGNVEIQVAPGADSSIRFYNGTQWVSMGLDASDSSQFKINYGDTVGSQNQLILTSTGDLIVNGKIKVKIDPNPLGEIKLRYIDAGADSGYYALYAP